jgi:ATP-dependent Clp endopeptidase proteolytic subunit ClpP
MPNDKKCWFSVVPSEEPKTIDVYIYDEIGIYGYTARVLIEQIKAEADAIGAVDNINVYLNSYGGEVFEGFSIYNELKQFKANVTTVINPIAASITSIIAMAGSKLKVFKNSFLMIHNPWVMTVGDANAHEKSAELLRMLEEKALDIYSSKTSILSRDEIRDLMNKETWIDAESAVLYGFADEIVDKDSQEPSPNQLSDIKPIAKMSLPNANYKMLFDNSAKIGTNKPNAGHKPTAFQEDRGMIKCKSCAKEIVEGSAHCNHCGWNQSIDPLQQASERERAEMKAQAAKQERERVIEITAKCQAFGLPKEFESELVNSGVSSEIAASKILDKVGEMKSSMSYIKVTKDGSDNFRRHASNCLMVASGMNRSEQVADDVRKGVAINGIHALMQHDLKNHGVDITGLTGEALYNKSIRMASTGTSDLPAVLGDIGRKTLVQSYTEAPTTARQWVKTVPVNDFRSQNLVKMSGLGDIQLIPEGAAFKKTRFSDKKETVSVKTKGIAWDATRQAMVNDDLGALLSTPLYMGASVSRQINYDVYESIVGTALAGPNMTEDGTALFQAAAARNGNLITSSGVPTVALISAAEKVLMTMPMLSPEKGAKTQYSNIPARYLITGVTNKTVTEQLLKTPYDSAKSIPGVYNPYTGIIPIFDATLGALLSDQSKPYAWYLVADQMAMESVVLAVLRGNEVPTIESEPSGIGEALGISFHCYFDYGIGISDWRGLVCSDGD